MGLHLRILIYSGTPSVEALSIGVMRSGGRVRPSRAVRQSAGRRWRLGVIGVARMVADIFLIVD